MSDDKSNNNNIDLEQVMLKYEKDVAAQTKSGHLEITDEHRALNRKVFAQLVDIVPFTWDIHIISEADVIFRFLIATKFNVDEAVKRIRATREWRIQNKMNEILWRPFDVALEKIIHFTCVDLEHRPVYLLRISSDDINKLLTDYEQPQVIDIFLRSTEQGRRLALSTGVDRAVAVMDLSQVGMRMLASPSAVGLLKTITSTISAHFPESNMRILCLNGGWVFSGLMKLLSTILDERIMSKIVNVGNSGDAAAREEIAKWIDVSAVPKSYGGDGPETDANAAEGGSGKKKKEFRALEELPRTPLASPPAWGFGAHRGDAFVDQAVVPAEENAAGSAATAAAKGEEEEVAK